MPDSSPPKDLLELQRRAKSAGLRAVLLSPCRAEGIVIFDPPDGRLSVRGAFLPGKTSLVIAEKVSCRLLLAGSGVELNVIMFPGRTESGGVPHFRFELEAWKPFIETS